jgi:hypothetical protein
VTIAPASSVDDTVCADLSALLGNLAARVVPPLPSLDRENAPV